ncbi:1,4-beta-xylanase, partial [Flavobacterium circumlabens]
MREIKLYLTLVLAGTLLISCNNKKNNSEENKKEETAVVEKREIWTKDQANKWYAEH